MDETNLKLVFIYRQKTHQNERTSIENKNISTPVDNDFTNKQSTRLDSDPVEELTTAIETGINLSSSDVDRSETVTETKMCDSKIKSNAIDHVISLPSGCCCNENVKCISQCDESDQTKNASFHNISSSSAAKPNQVQSINLQSGNRKLNAPSTKCVPLLTSPPNNVPMFVNRYPNHHPTYLPPHIRNLPKTQSLDLGDSEMPSTFASAKQTSFEQNRHIYPNVPYSPYGSPFGSPRNRRRAPLRESRRISIEQTGSFLQLNQYKLMDQIGQVIHMSIAFLLK